MQIVHHDRLIKQPIQPNGSTEGNISREKVMNKIYPQQFEVNEEQNEELHIDDSLESIDESGLTPSFAQPLIIVNNSIRNEGDEQSYYQEDNSNTKTLGVNDRMNRSEGETHPLEQEQLDATNVTENRMYPRRIRRNRAYDDFISRDNVDIDG